MDKKFANKIVEDTLEASFKKDSFIYFIKNLLNHIEEAPFVYRGNFIPDAYKKYINTLERVGKYTDGENNIDILIVNLKKETSIERARTMQRNFVAWYLNGSRGGELKDAALVAFVAPNQEDWRFSLVKMDYKFEETKNGKTKVKEVFTPARRWSFLVGKNENSHTAQSRLSPIVCDDEHNPTLEELEGAFNIEKVTKEFFEKYRELFLWVKESLDETIKKDRNVKQDFEAKGVNIVDFGKKLLGQIVFLYFLQKKGWFGVERDADWGTGPKNFLRELFKQKHGDYKNFFNDILEPLFYEALAREREDSFYSRFNCKIPFLNGGLFDPINNYDWVHTDILLPNDLFSNTYKTKEGDEGSGILDIFDRYNFTVKEDEPLEKEVAVDPEMLGKVFENLLEVKDRKSKGTYYTPREIVHYMCEQSLLNYLATEVGDSVKKDEIEKLLKHGESVLENEAHTEEKGKETKSYKFKLPESIRKNANLLDEKLADIKVCDPAVGSGAFPVGMMSEIVNARSVLSAYIKDENRTVYDFKRHCIQNSLYGVDIDPGAVEIAKLRLWLSLVVDEDDMKAIKPLPNLDYKIMQGNSLLEEFEGIKLFDEKLLGAPVINAEIFETNNQRISKLQTELMGHYIKNPAWLKNKELDRPQEVRNLETQLHELLKNKKMIKETGYEQKDLFASVAESSQIKDELEKLHKRFFEETNKNKKDKIKERIERLDWELIEITLKEQKKTSALKKLEEFRRSNTKPFFLWKLNFADVFEKRGGFDIVIANPPYNATLSSKERVFFKKNYLSVRNGRQDTAAIFVEKAKRIGNTKMQFAYILPYRLFSRKRNHGQFQSYTVNNFSIKNIIYLGTDVDFSANDEFMILILSASMDVDNLIKVAFKPPLNSLNKKNIFSTISQKVFIDKDEVNLNLVKFDSNLIRKIEGGTSALNSICEVKDGIVPYIREKLVSDKKIDSRYVRFAGIAGKYVLQKYFFSCNPLYLCYDIEEAKKYISDRKELRKVQLRDRDIFLHRKMISAQNCSSLKATIDEDKTFVSNSIHSIYLQENSKNDYILEYMLALFNSALLNYYHNFLRLKATDLHPQILVNDIKKLPIKKISLEKQKPFLKIVNKIMAITKLPEYLNSSEAQAKVKKYEAEIDQMVYKLYSLTSDEVKIIENHGR